VPTCERAGKFYTSRNSLDIRGDGTPIHPP
jgi:hypothetical protein